MKRYRVEPGSAVDLTKWNPDDRSGISGGRKKASQPLKELHESLAASQELLFAERKHKVLIVLQAMDTGGKDGTIKHVFGPLNPQGVQVVSFKKPSTEEMDHDYLWRAHRQVPGKGMVTIFNRSHYEDVLVVRVHDFVPQSVWSKRFDQINEFERMLVEEGTTILKFYLNISLDEQRKRLQARIDDPTKHWKLSPSDLPERALWSEYMAAYEEAISRTSTEWAPWYVVPANRKWYRDFVISTTIAEALKRLKMQYPEPLLDVKSLKIE